MTTTLTLAALAGYLSPLMMYLYPNTQRYLPVVVPVALLLLLAMRLLPSGVNTRGQVLVLLIGSLIATLFAARTSLPEARQHKATSLATNAVIDWMRGLDVGTDQEPVLVQGGMETTLSYNKLREVYVPDGAEVTFVSDAAGPGGLLLTSGAACRSLPREADGQLQRISEACPAHSTRSHRSVGS